MNKSDYTQHDKFKEATKNLGCDEDEARFKRKRQEVSKVATKGG